MIKVTALYGPPVDPSAFESYYFSTHMNLVQQIKNLIKAETTKFLPGPDGVNPPYYRMAELYFSSLEEFQKALGSPEGAATTADLSNFATGGVKLVVGEVDWTS
ncbi:MAG TPA: EthD family reductase [Algoriphagus sp.]|nr:EthD family reductase [Algoriphagus sp.]